MKPGKTESTTVYRFADVEFDAPAGPLRVGGHAVTLEPRPVRLLAELLARCNEVVTKEELFDTVWAGRVTVDHVVANAVSKLRLALGEEGAARLQTVPRVGYRFMGPVQRSSAKAATSGLSAGQRVPGRENFALEAPMGASGMSDVWRARHSKLGYLRVFKFADGAARLSALKREYTLYRVLRQELGARDDIAVIVDAQLTRAPYWLECEWGGQALSEWALDPANTAGMSRHDRLDMFIALAQAVDAAHGVGVLHKDIKPANVLVDGAPGRWRWRLTDFGAGRLLDADRLAALQLTALGLTQAADVATDSRSGTLAYLAPEVVVGGLHSVQADVYALGVLLYQWLAADLRRPLATGWQQDIDDLELCDDIQQATEGRPEKRLASAGALVDRLMRLPERRVERQQLELRRAAEKASAEKEYRRAVDEASSQSELAKAMQTFLTEDVLGAADVTAMPADGKLLASDVLEHASMRAAQRFQRLPHAQAEVRQHLGEHFFRLGAVKSSQREFETALQLLADTDPADDLLVCELHYALARVLLAQSRLAEGQQSVARGDAHAQAHGLSDTPHMRLAAARTKGQLCQMNQDYVQTAQLCTLAVQLTDQLAPQDTMARFVARRLLADAWLRTGRYDEAETLLREMLQTRFGPSAVGEVIYARAQSQWARLQLAQGRASESEAPLRAAIEVIGRRLGPTEHTLSPLHEELARTLEAQGRLPQARDAYRTAVKIAGINFGPDHQATRVNTLNLALLGLNDGDSQGALDALDVERPWFVAHMGGEDSPVVRLIDFYRLQADMDLGRTALAQRLLPLMQPEVLAQVTFFEWAVMLQTENARLQVLLNRQPQQFVQLAHALEVLRRAKGIEPWNLDRYEKLLAGSSGHPNSTAATPC